MDKADPATRALAYRIFSSALDLAAADRARFLDGECDADPALRAQVEALLEIAGRDSMATSSLVPLRGPAVEDLAGRAVGRFRLIERIGEGGMGVVYRAERIDGVRQSVAVKLVSRAMAARGQLRFARESQLLARLEHPAVARLIDAGVEEDRAWIAIEFVQGERIDAYCSRHALSCHQIVGLLVQLADAVAAAHRLRHLDDAARCGRGRGGDGECRAPLLTRIRRPGADHRRRHHGGNRCVRTRGARLQAADGPGTARG
jgi:serine/threonine-protein kinase